MKMETLFDIPRAALKMTIPVAPQKPHIVPRAKYVNLIHAPMNATLFLPQSFSSSIFAARPSALQIEQFHRGLGRRRRS
jgi:hypothetical protein